MGQRTGDSYRKGSRDLTKPTTAWVSLQVSEDDNSCPPGRKRTLRSVEYCREFCQSTSLHGLQYLGEKRRPLPERVCWLLVICISIICCSLVIVKQWNKWESSPVIVTFAETSTPAWDIPFPAVTICSEVKFKQSELNYTDIYIRCKILGENITEDEMKTLEYTSLLCEMSEFNSGNVTTDDGVIDHFLNITPSMNELLQGCRWRGQDLPCSDIFTPIITDDGVCYTFNTFAAQELFVQDVVQRNLTSNTPVTEHWSLEGGYDIYEDTNDTYPRRTLSAGAMAGLVVFLNPQDVEGDAYCRPPLEGFKMMLHNPAVFPEVTKQFFRVPSNRAVVVGVHPKVIRTIPELRSYSPETRQCFFEDERFLRFFLIYTQENCEFECYTNFTLERCACVEYYMPRNRSTPICGSGLRQCISYVQDAYNFDADSHDACNCLPACTEIKYDVETSQAGYMWGRLHTDYKDERVGTFCVFLKDMQIITSKRSELYGPSDFLANCGGLLGLFLGFSILSLVEILYFLSLRLFYNLWRQRRRAAPKRDE